MFVLPGVSGTSPGYQGFPLTHARGHLHPDGMARVVNSDALPFHLILQNEKLDGYKGSSNSGTLGLWAALHG